MCVVYGWDSHCTASQEWIVQMGVPGTLLFFSLLSCVAGTTTCV